MEINNKDKIIEYFSSGNKQESFIGVENEKFLMRKDDNNRVDYVDIKKILELFAKKYDWQRIYEGDVPIGWMENSTNNFFKDYPYVDMLVHQEGEYTVKQVFEKFLDDKDYSTINGLETIDYN